MKDKYPAYVDWETFERIQTMLRDNRAEYLSMPGEVSPFFGVRPWGRTE